MNESFKNKEIIPQYQLQQRLIAGTITLGDFLNELEDLDQSTPDRSNAIENLKVLEDGEVAALFRGSDESGRYYGFLSFTYFHRAQIRLHSANADTAVQDLEKALEYARLEDTEETSWVDYVAGTVAYMRNDIETLRECSERLVGTRNQCFTKSFIKGLEERGAPDYPTDYGNPIKV